MGMSGREPKSGSYLKIASKDLDTVPSAVEYESYDLDTLWLDVFFDTNIFGKSRHGLRSRKVDFTIMILSIMVGGCDDQCDQSEEHSDNKPATS